MLGHRLQKALSSRSNQHLAVDEDSDLDDFENSLVEESEPLLSRDMLTSTAQNSSHAPDDNTEQSPRSSRPSVSAWPLNNSSVDFNLKDGARQHNSSIDSIGSWQTAFRVGHGCRSSNSGEKTPQNTPTTVSPSMCPASQTVRPSLWHSVSSPGPDTYKSEHHDPTLDSATLQRRLISQTAHTGRSSTKSWRVRPVRTAIGMFQTTSPQASGRPASMLYPPRSSSDPSSTPQNSYKADKTGKGLPLKPCIKSKSKSGATTPPNESEEIAEAGDLPQKLRWAKTVGFDDVSRKLSSLPPLEVWTADSTPAATPHVDRSKAWGDKSGPKPEKVALWGTPRPGPVTKSMAAEPAVTRTDVHVVAITPSCDIGDVPDEGEIVPVIPTMQVVEPENRSYGIVWDDVSLAHDIPVHRRVSSASQTLVAVSPEFPRAPSGLDHVNTKLTDWTFGRGKPAELFKPQIIVSPDDYGRAPHFDCTVEDEEDLIVIAPRNSTRTSANTSGHRSRPASGQTYRSDSFVDDEIKPEEDTSREEGLQQDTLAAPNLDAPSTRLGHHIETHHRMRKPPPIRRLSNMDDFDVRFHGHRDSVALARNRISDADNGSLELFMQTHRDSVSIAKKRMHSHKRNHAISPAREIPQPQFSASDMDHATDDPDHAVLSQPAKSVATKALKSSSSPSMLLPQPASARRIRIVE